MEPDYREIVENSNSVILTVDSNGILTYINPYGLEFFGYTEEQLVGKHIIGTIIPETSSTGKDTAEKIHDIITHPERYVVNLGENMTSDGEAVWLLWSNAPVRDSQGNLLGMESIGTDMTDMVTQLGDGDPVKGYIILKRGSGVVK